VGKLILKVMDYEMSSNVGNWQWAAGTDATPYFRVFNPSIQLKNSMKSLY
jgi:deoxyribodipyrimidine photo-lyase